MNKKYNFITKQFLFQEYIQNKKSMKRIAKQIGCSKIPILNRLKKYKIPIRTNGESHKGQILSIETKEKISKKLKGRTSPNKGKKFSKEHKEKIRLSCLNNPNMSHKVSEKTRKILSNYAKSRIGKKSHNWKGGKSFEPYPFGWTNVYKEQIRKRDNYTCQKCRIKQQDYYRKLDIHHIDYNKENLNPNNLITLCQSCHMKTNNNRISWKEYFKCEVRK